MNHIARLTLFSLAAILLTLSAGPSSAEAKSYLLETTRVDGNNNAASSIDFAGDLNGPGDWTMETDIKILKSAAGNNTSFGFAGFSLLPDLDTDRILADIRIGDGRIRLNGFTGATSTAGGPVSEGDLIHLAWETDYDFPNVGDVTMTLTYDNLTTGMQGVVTGTDLISNLKPGQHFGFRNRALSDGKLGVTFDNFSVTGAVSLSEDFEDEMLGDPNPGLFNSQPASGTDGISFYAVVPEPSAGLLMLVSSGLFGATSRRLRHQHG